MFEKKKNKIKKSNYVYSKKNKKIELHMFKKKKI
jgi:hypothetical protein